MHARAQKQSPPEGGPAKAFTVPAHETYTLPNGLKVTLVPYGIIPKVTVDITIVAGSADEGKDHQGVAGLAAELMKEGTEKSSAGQVADEAARMGSALDVSSSYDRTDARLDVLSEFGADAVRLLSDVIMHPRLPESELDRLKNDTVAADRPGLFRAADHRVDALPQNPLRRSPLQCRFAVRGRRKEDRDPGCEELHLIQFQSPANAHLCGGKI